MGIKVQVKTRPCEHCESGVVPCSRPADAACDACERSARDCGCVHGTDCDEHGVLP